MKKLFTTLLAASAMLAGTSVFAQNMAIEAGFGLSTTKFDYTLKDANIDLFGGTVGFSYEIPLMENIIGFAPGIQFGCFTKNDVNLLGFKVSFTESYLAFPLDFNFHTDLSEDMKLIIFAGPTIDVGLSSKVKEKKTKIETDIYDDTLDYLTDYSRMDVLLGGGVGFDVMDVVRFSIRYDYGLVNRNRGNFSNNILKIHRSQLKFGVAYLF